MAIATGINKRVVYKKEDQWGIAPTSTGGKVLRRVTASFDLNKESFESAEIRTDQQVSDFRHSIRSVSGTLSGELSPGSYADFFAAAVARDFTAGVSATGVSYTIAASGDNWTVTRDAGDFLANGFKIGNVIRITAAGGNAANTGKNLLIVGLTSTVATVTVLNGSDLFAEGPIASATIAVQGKVTYAPLTGHTDTSFSIESFYADIAQSELTTGNKVNTVGVSIPTSGLATVDFGFMGKDRTNATSAYFSSPSSASTTGIFSSATGVLVVNGAPVAVLTSLSVNINRNMQNATVVGSSSIQDVFEGRIVVDGTFDAYFTDGTLRGYFENETEISLVAALAASNTKDADVFSVVLPRVKLNSDTKNDGESGITTSVSFRALLNTAGGTGVATEATTIFIQDSAA